MTARKLISLLLAVAMLLGTTVAFASCTKKKGTDPVTGGEPEEVSGDSAGINLSNYYLVYSDVTGSGAARLFTQLCTAVADRMTAATGKGVTARSISRTVSEAADPEILIGNIQERAESQTALRSIQGNGFTIQTINNKLCIVGSNLLLTMQAVQYFLEHDLTETASATISVTPTQVNNVEMIRLAQTMDEEGEQGGLLPLVYSSELQDNKQHTDPFFRTTYADYDMRAYPVKVSENILVQLAQITSTRAARDFKRYSDATTAKKPEFSVGNTNRPVCKQLLAELSGSEYGFLVTKNGCALGAWSDDAMISAYNLLMLPLLEEATVTENGSTYIAFPVGFKLIGVHNNKWVTDFPKPEGTGISLYNVMDDGNDCLQYLYSGQGVSTAAFDDYCEKLQAAGYTPISENTIEGSQFATLVNNEAGVMLYVAYNAFAHKNDYSYSESHYNYQLFHAPVLRIVSSATSNRVVPVPSDTVLQRPAAWEKRTDTAVTAVGLDQSSTGMSYIVTLEDGSFILFDGGAAGSNNSTVTTLYNVLRNLYKDIYNHLPTTEDPIRIAAWVITHSHSDHYIAAERFMTTYDTKVKVENVIGNFPAPNDAYCLNNSDNGHMGQNSVISSLTRTVGAKFLKAHTGQKYYFANMEVEVLMTYEDLNPMRLDNSNDTCTVLRFKVYTDANQTTPSYTIIWTGDANRNQSRWLCAMYGSNLKADMVQFAHHGNVGCDKEFYDTVKPNAVLFPNTLARYSLYTNGSNQGNRPYYVDYTVLQASNYVHYLFISEEGSYTTIPFKNGVADFQAAYDVMTSGTGKFNHETVHYNSFANAWPTMRR